MRWRSTNVEEVPIPELAFTTAAKTADRAIDKEHAGVLVADCDTLDGHGRAEIDGCQGIAHFAGIVADVICVPLAQFAGQICAPTFERVVVEYRTGMTGSRADGACRPPVAEIDKWEIVTHLAYVITDACSRAVA